MDTVNPLQVGVLQAPSPRLPGFDSLWGAWLVAFSELTSEMPTGFVQALANCRDFDVGSATNGLSFQPLTIGASIATYARKLGLRRGIRC
jgi:hypothetical protein